MKYFIAIPSYKRSDTVKNKTLATIQKYNIDPSIVSIFVADENEYKDYRKSLKNTPFYDNIIIGAPTLRGARNFIQNHYPEDTCIVNMDDDLQEIQYRVDEKNLAPVEDLDAMIREGFTACKESGSRLWGIYAASNPFFMHDRVSNGLYYVIGSLWGCINSHREASSVTLEDKEDYERTLKYYDADGVVSRLDYITVKSAYYREAGGMQETRTEKRIEDSAKFLAEKYPDLCTMYYRKTTGHAELRLKDKRPKKVESSLESFFG